jgi:hypothetical protein
MDVRSDSSDINQTGDALIRPSVRFTVATSSA